MTTSTARSFHRAVSTCVRRTASATSRTATRERWSTGTGRGRECPRVTRTVVRIRATRRRSSAPSRSGSSPSRRIIFWRGWPCGSTMTSFRRGGRSAKWRRRRRR
uniref:(northern house mosquito) hypothetical protein n=1 Tax=Culex pipiens TaxID=7175 RepID=A0A8D8E546_CULPI